MENVPEFVETVGTFAKAASLAPAALVLGPALAPYGRALLPYADKAAAVAGRALSSRLVQGAFLADSLFGIPEIIEKVDQSIATGENIGETAFDVGLTTLELILAKGPLKGALNKAAKLIKPAEEALQTPFTKMIPKFNAYENAVVAGRKGLLNKSVTSAMHNLTPGQMLTATSIAGASATIPSLIDESQDLTETLTDTSIPWKQRYEASKRFGSKALSTGLSLTPLSNMTRPIGATRAAAAYALPSNVNAFVQGNLGSGLGMFTSGMKFINPKMGAPAVTPYRQPVMFGYKEGGNVSQEYIDVLSTKEINELKKQGYKIEYLD
jgi:hypothetical protein